MYLSDEEILRRASANNLNRQHKASIATALNCDSEKVEMEKRKYEKLLGAWKFAFPTLDWRDFVD